MLAKSGILAKKLSSEERMFLDTALQSIERLLPHVKVRDWSEGVPSAHYGTARRMGKEVALDLYIRPVEHLAGRQLRATIARRKDGLPGAALASGALDARELDICQRIAEQISVVLGQGTPYPQGALAAISATFDEHVVANHIAAHHDIDFDISALLAGLHKLAEQTYENKALSFGCIIDPGIDGAGSTLLSDRIAEGKKHKALTDGYRTAYVLTRRGDIAGLVDLSKYTKRKLTEKHFFPEWARYAAQSSLGGKVGVVLSRQGDLLIFDEGTLRFTYRYGRWQYWNHQYLVKLLKGRARAQGVQPKIVGNVVGAIYRAAIDVSFRRAGALFVILHNKKKIREIVRHGEAIGDTSRDDADSSLDSAIEGDKIQNLSRPVVVEISSLDGAVVLANSGEILAYGAVLRPKKSGKSNGTEGSRTKAAIGASKYGTAVKVSSDGDVTIYYDGKMYLSV